MNKKLSRRKLIAVSSMLFGMFFGAGNLIFPAALGPQAGGNLVVAFLGLFITAVGLPLLAVVALGMSRCNLVQLTDRVGHGYSLFFTTLLYLTIGPLFAIPRCASTSFSVGAVNLISTQNTALAQAIFSFAFFAVVLLFSLKPSGIMVWIGKILNPTFLLFLGCLIVAALANPVDSVASVAASEAYQTTGSAFLNGFLEGYNTLDALAGLAFGIVVVNVVRSLGIKEPGDVAKETAKAGIFSCLAMGVVYFAITLVATQSTKIVSSCKNGGEVLGTIAGHFFGSVGAVLMTAIVTFACLKTAIGLVTSCSEAFVLMFPKGPKYRFWAVIFSVVSFGIANFGLTTIVAYCVPVLMFLYPLAITLIILALVGKLFDHDRRVYICTTALTLVAAILDFISALAGTLKGSGVAATPVCDAVTKVASDYLPLFTKGMGWIVPAAIGFAIGLVLHFTAKKK